MATGDERVTFGMEDNPQVIYADEDYESMVRDEVEEVGRDAKPVQLVKITSRGALELCPEGLRLLSSLEPPLAIISFAGPYRSGKSFALNLMLDSPRSGFTVGSTVKACTQGIWLWGAPQRRKGVTYVLLDSEGSGSTGASPDRDGKLFALVILVSSLFVFNTVGVIDEHAINQLSLAAYLYEQLSADEYQEDEDLQAKLVSFSPKFIWLLRDFHLTLVDRHNQPLSPRDYMDNILTSEVKGRNIENIQKARKILLELFVDRDCFVVPRPADSEADLNQLDQLPLSQLRPKFVEAFEKFKTVAFEGCPVKKFGGREVSGKHLAAMFSNILDAINRGVLPNIESGWDNILASEYEEMLKQMKIKYLKLRNVSLEHMPYEEADLVLKLHVRNKQNAKDGAVELAVSSPMKDPRLERETLDEFEGFFEDDVKYSLSANSTASEAFNLALLKSLFAPIIEKLNSGEYKTGSDAFEVDWGRALKQYEQGARGPGKLTAVNNFIIEHQNTAIAGYFQGIIDELNSEIMKLRNSSVENDDRLAHLRELLKNQEEGEKRFQEQVTRIEQELELDNRDKTLMVRLKEILTKLGQAKVQRPETPVTPRSEQPPVPPKRKPQQQKACCVLS